MSVRRAFVWSFAGQGLSLVALLVSLVWLSRILNPSEMGAYAVGQAVSGVLVALSALGLGSYLVREDRIGGEILGSALAISLTLGVTLALGAFLGAGLVAKFVGNAAIEPIVRWIAVIPFLAALELVPQAILQREMRFGALAAVFAARSVVTTTVAIAAALAGERYMCVAYATVSGAAVSVVASHLAAPGHMIIRPNFAHWNRLVGFGGKMLAVGGISILSMRVSEMTMAAILGLAALGIYSRASSIYNTVYSNLFGSIGKVLMARLAVDLRAGRSLGTSFLGGLNATLALMWPFLLGVALLAPSAVQLVFGAQWYGAIGPLAILMVAQAISMTFGMSSELFILRDQVGRQARYESVRSSMGLGLVALGCLVSLEAAALGRVVEMTLTSMWYIPQILRLADITWKQMWSVLKANIAVTIPTLLPAAFLMAVYDFSPFTPLPLVALSVVSGLALWLGAIFATRHPLAFEVKNVWRKALAWLWRARGRGI